MASSQGLTDSTRCTNALRHDPCITWANAWHDDAANAEVRALSDGNEYTPTVLIGDLVLRSPSASEVRSQLRASPHSVNSGQRARLRAASSSVAWTA